MEEHKFPIWGVKYESKKLTYKQIMEFNENACEEYKAQNKAQKNLEMILNFNTETGDFEELKRYLLESISEKIDINGIKLDQKQDNEFKRNVQEMSQYSDVNAEELYNKLSSDSINLLKNPLMLMMQFVNVQGTKQKSAKEAIKNVQKQNNSDFKNLIVDVKQIHKGLSNGQNSLKDDTNKFDK